jgi:hypothetical protein
MDILPSTLLDLKRFGVLADKSSVVILCDRQSLPNVQKYLTTHFAVRYFLCNYMLRSRSRSQLTSYTTAVLVILDTFSQ